MSVEEPNGFLQRKLIFLYIFMFIHVCLYLPWPFIRNSLDFSLQDKNVSGNILKYPPVTVCG